nr:BBP7 family outer membrane beta-barrel protein [Rhodopirellula sp. SM50]
MKRFCALAAILISSCSVALYADGQLIPGVRIQGGRTPGVSEPWRVEGEFMFGWLRGMKAPPLVTTSPRSNQRAQAGVIGEPGTSIVYGDDDLDNGIRQGIRLRLERVLTNNCLLYASAFYLGDDDSGFTFKGSDVGLPLFARPFTNVQTMVNDSELVSFPNVLAGAVAISTNSELYGFDVGFRKPLANSRTLQTSVSAGYRMIDLSDEIGIREELVSIAQTGVVAQGTLFVVEDEFEAQNQFHGLNLQFDIDKWIGPWRFSLRSSLAFGDMQREISIAGQTTTTVPTQAPIQTVGGLLTQPTNIGAYESNEFTVVPEIKFMLGHVLQPGIEFQLGYNLLILPDVLRSPEQIDLDVNESQIGGGTLNGPARPEFQADSQTAWMQAIVWNVVFTR